MNSWIPKKHVAELTKLTILFQVNIVVNRWAGMSGQSGKYTREQLWKKRKNSISKNAEALNKA